MPFLAVCLAQSCASSTIYLAAFGLVGCPPFERCTPAETRDQQWQMWLVLGFGALNALYFPGIRTTVCASVGRPGQTASLGTSCACVLP
eukprot:SAG22_NODE_10643_length_523_cov_1.334906_1_plen_88_part_01